MDDLHFMSHLGIVTLMSYLEKSFYGQGLDRSPTCIFLWELCTLRFSSLSFVCVLCHTHGSSPIRVAASGCSKIGCDAAPCWVMSLASWLRCPLTIYIGAMLGSPWNPLYSTPRPSCHSFYSWGSLEYRTPNSRQKPDISFWL